MPEKEKLERNKNKCVEVIRELLKGNPVITICGNGVFTGGGHFIVIAGIKTDQVNDLKRKNGIATISDATERDARWTETINSLKYEDLKDLDIYVLDPRYKHEYGSTRTSTKKTDGKKAKTMSTAWDIDTFSYGGAGNSNEFWVYKKRNTAIDLGCSESELFDFNKTKYPSDYKEYFDPQEPEDGDKFCNPSLKKYDFKRGEDYKAGFFKSDNQQCEQEWKKDFPQLK